jgi:hypothetical protein
VTTNAFNLATGLESSKHASASSKKAAVSAVIQSNTLAYEVATVFVPLIAEKKYVSWNGFTYINLIEDKAEGNNPLDIAANKERMQNMVAFSLPVSMGQNISDMFGTRKLGQVFLALIGAPSDLSPLKKFILYCLLIRSKPSGWLDKAKSHLIKIDRRDLYLRHMLTITLRQFRNEINTESERIGLKELVVAIRLRRDANVKSPSATAIKKAIDKLDQHGFWDNKEENLSG